MKKLILAVFFFYLCFGLPAQVLTTSLIPHDTRAMGMGGAFRVFSTGYSTFFGNPAGFAGPKSLTLGDFSSWAYLKPYPVNISPLIAIAQGQASQSEFESTIGSLMAENHGFGGGFALGLGLAGGGFGMGLTLISDALAQGVSYAGSAIEAKSQANAIFGLALPLELGKFSLKFGVDVRAFYRLDSHGDWPFSHLVSALYSGTGFETAIAGFGARGGFGLAVDSGATLSWGPLSAGVMIRDYGYKFYMDDTTIGDIVKAGIPPMSGDILCALKTQYSGGLSLVLGSGGPLLYSFYAEVDDPMTFISKVETELNAAFSLIHAGCELKILKFLSLRGGVNQGLASLGFGMDFALVEVDAALFSETISQSSSRTGVSIQLALHI